jgi:hypothetical protein
MSIELRLEELTQAINGLPAAIALALGNATPPVKENGVQGYGATADTTTESVVEETTAAAENLAGRKTYVWNKTTKTGEIVEKGGVVPTGDDLVNVGKVKWEAACEKYDVDPATGKKLAEEAESEPDNELADQLDDLDDLDSDGADDLDDLEDLEDEATTINRDDVKKVMVRVMREVGREDALKLFKSHGARNFDEVKDDKLGAMQDAALAVLKKAGK